MKEVEVQSMIIKSVKFAGGYGHKSSNPFIHGLPDIFIAHPEVDRFFTEVKIGNLLGSGDVSWTGTEPQKRCLRDMMKAGQPTFWTIVWKDGKSWKIRAAHPLTLQWLISESLPVTPIGSPEGWPMVQLMSRVKQNLVME